MNLTLKVWRQKNAAIPGYFANYRAKDVLEDMSFLEMCSRPKAIRISVR